MTTENEMNDAQLAGAVGRFCHEALTEVYRRHARALLTLAWRVTGNSAEAEDVTEEVFARFWTHPDRFDASRGSLRSYLLIQCHSRAVEVVRSRSARLRRETRYASGVTASAGYDVAHAIYELALADQVVQAMRALPADERQAIQLAYFEGRRTYREVAQLLAQPEGTVKSRIRSGLRRLQHDIRVTADATVY